MKQWGQTPDQIDPNTTARVPVFLSEDDRYFQDEYQGMPLKGYAPLFEAMLDHPNITVRLGEDAIPRLGLDGDVLTVDGVPFQGPVVYTGAADELFGRRFGPLPYRTLDFRFETLDQTWFQSRGAVNYTVDQPYTRITEFKHMTLEKSPRTVILKEYSKNCDFARGDIPYYPILSPESTALFEKYTAALAAYKNLYLIGRLAEYRYYNMDAAVSRALAAADEILAAHFACGASV